MATQRTHPEQDPYKAVFLMRVAPLGKNTGRNYDSDRVGGIELLRKLGKMTTPQLLGSILRFAKVVEPAEIPRVAVYLDEFEQTRHREEDDLDNEESAEVFFERADFVPSDADFLRAVLAFREGCLDFWGRHLDTRIDEASALGSFVIEHARLETGDIPS